MTNRNAFTLVELLSVIAVLSLILIIAVPKVTKTIDESKKRTLELSVKSIARSAEETYLENDSFGITDEITCENVSDISNKEYQSCKIDFNEDGKAFVTYIGKGNYKELNVCGGTKENAEATADKCPVNFADDDWSTIVRAAKGGYYPYKAGDEKTIDSGDLAGHIIRVANTTPCSEVSVESQTACGFVLEFAGMISSKEMHDVFTNEGGWPATAMRTYLNDKDDDESVYNLLPEDLKNGIIDTYVVSGHGNADTGTKEDGNFESTDKLYLLSTREVWGNNPGQDTAAGSSITRQLDYYNINNVTPLIYDGAIKNTSSGGAIRWLLRSARSIDTYHYYCVNSDGYWEIRRADMDAGVSPAFRLAE